MMNLNTKKAIVEEGGTMEWVSGSFGSHISMLYPMSVLNGKYAKTEFTGISFAGATQNLDNGFKAILNAPNTSAVVNAKSLSKNGGKCTYRSLIKAKPLTISAKASASLIPLLIK